MAVVGAFIAMITPRSYRVTRSIEDAKEEIKRSSGTQFDPKIVDIFLGVIEKREIRDIIEGEYNRGLEQIAKGTDIL